MASFAQTLRSYSAGSLSREDLFSSLEDILSENRIDTPWLLKILDEEHQEVSLPQEVYDAVKQKVLDATGSQQNEAGLGDLNGSVKPNVDNEDLSRTQIATSFFRAQRDDSSVTTDSNARKSSETNGDFTQEITIKGVGDVLNERFVLEERVGSGGMSTVYRALDRRKLEADDRDPYIAVKILNLEFRSHPDSLIALQREAKKCHKLAHPNIVRAYDFDRDGATVFMTMEYLTGHSLAKVLRDPGFQGMSFEQAMPIIKGMSEALSYAHKNGIVHADFKPANVILTAGGEVKVIDFGIARAFQQQGDSDTEVTRFDPGSLGALTPTYASPEMLEHKEPDPRDDVYALACIVYEMLTGRHPFGRRQANEARDGGLTLQRKTLSRRQWRALNSALHFDRDKRTPSVSEFFADINPECSRTPIFIAIAASVFITALLIGMGAFIYNGDGFDTALSDNPDGKAVQPVVEPPAIGMNSPEVQPQNKIKTPVIREQEKVTAETKEVEPEIAKVESPTNVPAKKEKAVEPEIPAPSDDQILQNVRVALNTQNCSALVARVNSGNVEISGYLLESVSRNNLQAQIKKIAGVKKVEANLETLNKSMCDVINVYRQYWVSNQENGLGANITSAKTNSEFIGGEPLVVKLKTPKYDSYVNVDYYSQDGHVVHMLPSQRARQNQAPANYDATLGDLGQWIVSEPYGKELVVILTSPFALFQDMRKEYEKTSEYLTALSQRLDKLDQKSQKSKIAADFVFISTRAK